MFTYFGRYRVSGTRNEIPADDLEAAQLHVEEAICLALLEYVGPLLVERVELAPVVPASVMEYTLEIVLHSPDHSTLLRQDMRASARRHIDGTLHPLLTELFGHVRAVRTSLTHTDTDAAWGEVLACSPAAAPVPAARRE